MRQVDDKLYAALRCILRPVICVLIARNVTLQSALGIIKLLYVEEAETLLLSQGRKPTDSQVSVMTGVHRKDVKDIRGGAGNPATPSKQASVVAELLATWLGDSDFLDGSGKPLPLPYINREAPRRSFAALAGKVSKDVRPRALLDDFVRLNLGSEDKVTGLVTLRADALVPQGQWEEKLFFFGKNCGDHLSASAANILAEKPPFMDRSVYHDGLTTQSAEDLKAFSVDAAMKMLRLVNRKAFELSDKDKGKEGAVHTMNLGVFYYAQKAENDEGA